MAAGRSRDGLLYALFGVLLFTPDALLFRLAATDSITLIVWRAGLLVLVTLLYVYMTTHRADWRRRWTLDRLGWIAVLAAGFNELSFVPALLNAPAADALVVFASAPLLTALIGWLWFREAPTLATIAAMLVAGLGVLLTVHSATMGGSGLGTALALAAALFVGIQLNALRFSNAADPFVVLILGKAIAVVIAVSIGRPAALSTEQLGFILLNGVLLMPLSSVLIAVASRKLPSGEIALLFLLETVLGPFWVWLVLREAPSTTTVIGGLIVLTAVAAHALYVLRTIDAVAAGK